MAIYNRWPWINWHMSQWFSQVQSPIFHQSWCRYLSLQAVDISPLFHVFVCNWFASWDDMGINDCCKFSFIWMGLLSSSGYSNFNVDVFVWDLVPPFKPLSREGRCLDSLAILSEWLLQIYMVEKTSSPSEIKKLLHDFFQVVFYTGDIILKKMKYDGSHERQCDVTKLFRDLVERTWWILVLIVELVLE